MTSDRRAALKLAGLAAILPCIGARSAFAATTSARGHFAPPPTPLLYSRTLVRTLGDGAQVLVRRDFSIRFARHSEGFRIDGSQVAAEVQMPESLSQLAKIERERREENLFPIQLDSSGQIRGGPEYKPAEHIDRAVAVVEQRVSGGNFDEEDRQAISGMLQAAHRQGESLVSALPGDLFSPSAASKRDVRDIPLPGGTTGSLEVLFEARVDPKTGLLQQAERRIVTRLSDSERVTSETWAIGPF